MQEVSTFCDRCNNRLTTRGRLPIERRIDIPGYQGPVSLWLVAKEDSFNVDTCDDCEESIKSALECLAEGIEG